MSPSTERFRRLFEVAAGLTAPPIVGLAIIVLVMSGGADASVRTSGAATSTALIVGALLMLVPPILYGATRYAAHQDMVEDRFKRLVDEVAAMRARANDGGDPAPRPSPTQHLG